MSDYKKKRRRSMGTLIKVEEIHKRQRMSVVVNLTKDQVIISEEIMSMILENLDFRSLKQVRLVCKRWLREAQTHMERRGIIRFDRYRSTRRIREFEDLRRNKIQDLPQPFHCVDVDIDRNNLARVVQLFSSPSSSSSSPLALARFSTESFDVDLAVRLIIEHSSSLEYLKLTRETFNDAHTLKKSQIFPKLRHLVVKDAKRVDNENDIYATIDFPSFVAKIVKGSPNLETFESHNKAEPEGRELLRTVDIKNVKTLTLDYLDPKQSVVDHFLATSFDQLQNFKLLQYDDDSKFTRSPLEIIKTCSATLRVLDVKYGDHIDDIPELPLCPNVQELMVQSFPSALSILPRFFPSLQVLEVISVEEVWWKFESPIPGLKTLRVLNNDLSDRSATFYVMFFKKIPGLVCLSLNVASILSYCRIQASEEPRFSKILQGLKHLEIRGRYVKDSDNDGTEDCDECKNYDGADVDDKADDTDFSSLATLKGVEMITLLESNKVLMRIPVHSMPDLKVLRFPWGAHHSMAKLLALAKGMEKVVITNCCTYPRVGNP